MKQRMRKVLVAVAGLALAAFTPFAASAGEEVYEMKPYASMDLDLSQPMPNGTFLIQSPQLAFPGYKLTDLAGKGMFGCMSGSYVSIKGLGPVVNLKFYPSEDSPTKALCSLNYVNSETKAVVIQLTDGEDGVYAEAAPNTGSGTDLQTPARYLSEGAITMLCAEFTSTGDISYKQNKGTLATTDAGAGHGARGLTLERFLNTTKPVLAFAGATLEDIEGYSFSGYSCGQFITVGQATPMRGYNVTLVGEESDRKLRVEMQLREGTTVKCVVVEFTDGEGGVYVKPLAARYKAGAYCGFKFVNDDGSYNGIQSAVATDFSMAGYGVFRLKAVQPPQNVAVWTGEAGDGDISNDANWKDGTMPNDESTVQIGGDIYMNWPEDSSCECAAIEFTSAVKLTDNCDWSGMLFALDMKGFPLDLNGKQLTVSKMMTGTVTDLTTDTANPGQLIVSVAEDEETENTTMALEGNAQLVKEGEGLFVSNMAQSYTGGTTVNAGTLKLADGATVGTGALTVNEGAKLDIGTHRTATVVGSSAGTVQIKLTDDEKGTLDAKGSIDAFNVSGDAFDGTVVASDSAGAAYEIEFEYKAGKLVVKKPSHADEVKLPLKFGFNPMTACRKDSGESRLSLSNIKPIGEDVSGKIFIVKVSALGSPSATYQWLDMGEGPCWVDSDLKPVTGVFFNPGEGFIVQCNCADGTVNLQMAGDPIEDETITVGLQSGRTQAGNPFSKTIDLNSIVADDGASDNVTIVLRDSQGKITATYWWNDWFYDVPCWVDGNYDLIPDGTVTFGPGVGFSVECGSTGHSIVFTNPL